MKLYQILSIAVLISCGKSRPEIANNMDPGNPGRYFFQKDSIGWRLIKDVPGAAKGSGVVTYSQYTDSASAVALLADVIRIRKRYIDAKAWEPELKDMEALMDKVTGRKVFSGSSQDLVGSWLITDGRDSLRVNINSFLTVSGEGIKGKIYTDETGILLMKEVLPGDIPFKWEKPGLLAGPNNIKMIKSQ